MAVESCFAVILMETCVLDLVSESWAVTEHRLDVNGFGTVLEHQSCHRCDGNR